MEIWEFDSYCDYLLAQLGGEGQRTGLRKKLAEAIPVHTTFISQVLNGRAHLSLEQSEVVSSFFGHSEVEADYFMLLVMRDRAGSAKLRQRLDRKLTAARAEHLQVTKRLGPKDSISQSERERFYSSYVYGAAHVLAGVPGHETVEALADRLHLSRAKAREIVDFLLRLGLLVNHKGKIGVGSNHVHLSGHSELVAHHHTNWRLHALRNLQHRRKDDLHYSACMSLSRRDVEKVKDSILKNLKDNVDLISESKPEVAYVMGLDFYEL